MVEAINSEKSQKKSWDTQNSETEQTNYNLNTYFYTSQVALAALKSLTHFMDNLKHTSSTIISATDFIINTLSTIKWLATDYILPVLRVSLMISVDYVIVPVLKYVCFPAIEYIFGGETIKHTTTRTNEHNSKQDSELHHQLTEQDDNQQQEDATVDYDTIKTEQASDHDSNPDHNAVDDIIAQYDAA